MSIQSSVLDVFTSGGKTWAEHAGDTLIVGGHSGLAKIFDTRSPDEEPNVVDIPERFSSISVSPKGDMFVVTSGSGEAEYFSLGSVVESLGTLARSELALRDACFTHSGRMVMLGGDDGDLLLVDLESSPLAVRKFPAGDQIRSISYNKVFELAAVTLFGGKVKIFSLISSEPQAVASLQSAQLGADQFYDEEKEDQRCVRCAWSPDGDYIAVPSESSALKVFSRGEYDDAMYTVKLGGDILAYNWAPNCRYLAIVSSDKMLSVYSTSARKIVKTASLRQRITNVSWRMNGTSYDVALGTLAGQVINYTAIVEQTLVEETTKSAASLFVDDEASDDDDMKEDEEPQQKGSSRTSPGIDDSGYGLEDDFIIDDDQGSYVSEKRAHDGLFGEAPSKSRKTGTRPSPTPTTGPQQPAYEITPYSCGETPWYNNKRYLTMNSVGYAWSVKQDEYNTVTVSFFDRGSHKEYYFKDVYGYDVASLDDNAVLLAVSGKKGSTKARVLFRSHDNADDSWERVIPVAKGEIVTSVSLSANAIFVCTSHGYVRRFSLHGLLESIEKARPVIACVTSEKYVLTISVSSHTQFSYSLQDLEGKYLQRDGGLPLHISQDGHHLIKGLFFSSDGDPCLVGKDDVLLVLSRWRDPLQARWMPILDTQLGLTKMSSGAKNLRCWPLGLFRDQFAFIIVKGSYYPSFPLTIPSELAVKIPTNAAKEEEEDDEQVAEEELARSRVLGELLNDAITSEEIQGEEATERLQELSMLFDKSLLKLFAAACTEQNSRKAISLAVHLREDKALAAAGRIAERLEMTSLASKINTLREARLEFD